MSKVQRTKKNVSLSCLKTVESPASYFCFFIRICKIAIDVVIVRKAITSMAIM